MAEPSEIPQPVAQMREEEEGAPTPLRFNLHIVSPSVGVSGPVKLENLLATTTVKELKSKIRDALPLKPADENQRLIHRGRMLGRETETMLEIFGQETLTSTESQTIHLVLRPTASEPPSQPIASTPASILQQAMANPPMPPQFPPRPQSTPLNPIQRIHTPPGLGFQQQYQHLQHQQQDHSQQVAQFQQGMAQRLGQLQAETVRLQQEIVLFESRARAVAAAIQNNQPAPPGPGIPPQSIFRPAGPPPAMPPSVQHILNQQQRERAAEGRQGAQDNVGLPNHGQRPQPTAGQAIPSNPGTTTTSRREGVGPNGARWSVTVNQTVTRGPPGGTLPFQYQYQPQAPPANPAVDIQAVLRNADRFLEENRILPLNGQNNMQRTASNPTPMQTIASGAQRPETSGQATPTTTNSSPSASTILNPLLNGNIPVINAPIATTTSGSSSNTNQPMVYLLSSPSGPRALLMTNTETYFTPRHSSRRRLSPAATAVGQAPGGPVGLPEYRNRPAQRAVRRNAQPDAAQAAPQPLPNALHGNPPAGALGAQIGPIIWLLVRLCVFVWFFTSGNPSWTRWLIIVGLGIAVFLYNTGALNGIGNQIFGPARRYLENLIPLAGPEAALIPAQNAAILQPPPANNPAGGLTPAQRARGELDPTEAAERILEQRRQRLANGGWLMAQIRRVEHSLLLFLASFVPGVGERHIAAREAEAMTAAIQRAQVEARAEADAAQTAARQVELDAIANGDVEAIDREHSRGIPHQAVADSLVQERESRVERERAEQERVERERLEQERPRETN